MTHKSVEPDRHFSSKVVVQIRSITIKVLSKFWTLLRHIPVFSTHGVENGKIPCSYGNLVHITAFA